MSGNPFDSYYLNPEVTIQLLLANLGFNVDEENIVITGGDTLIKFEVKESDIHGDGGFRMLTIFIEGKSHEVFNPLMSKESLLKSLLNPEGEIQGSDQTSL